MFISNMRSGTRHDHRKVTMITSGGLGGELRTGRVSNYLGAGDSNRKLCGPHLGIMDWMGVRLDRFGDADSRLANL